MTQKFLLGVDTKDMPGKVKLTSLMLSVDYVNEKDFVTDERFVLLTKDHPVVKAIRTLFP